MLEMNSEIVAAGWFISYIAGLLIGYNIPRSK